MGEARYRVLVVDGYADTAETLCQVVQHYGHPCVAVTTGRQAVTMAQVFAPDVVLLDLYLPDMDGLDLARVLHTLPRIPTIIVVTGWAQPQERARAEASRVIDGFHLKPMRLHDLDPPLCPVRCVCRT